MKGETHAQDAHSDGAGSASDDDADRRHFSLAYGLGSDAEQGDERVQYVLDTDEAAPLPKPRKPLKPGDVISRIRGGKRERARVIFTKRRHGTLDPYGRMYLEILPAKEDASQTSSYEWVNPTDWGYAYTGDTSILVKANIRPRKSRKKGSTHR